MNEITLDLRLQLPDWVSTFIGDRPQPEDDTGRMRFAIELSRHNVSNGTGGPFGAAVFSSRDGRLLSVGLNCVERLNNSVLHAEVMALMLAEQRLGRYSLQGDEAEGYALFTSCAPCAMCLGAILWSGVRRVVCGAGKMDAQAIGFDEGPVFAESYRHLEAKGIRIEQGLLADEARAVMDLYRQRGGLIYNP